MSLNKYAMLFLMLGLATPALAQSGGAESGGAASGAGSASAPAIVQAQPPESAPVAGAGGQVVDYAANEVGMGENYTHPNGIGSDWADDGVAEPIVDKSMDEQASGQEAQNAAKEDGGDSPAAPAAPAGPIVQAEPPKSDPVAGAGGQVVDYATDPIGQGEGYTHPNGFGADWASSQ